MMSELDRHQAFLRYLREVRPFEDWIPTPDKSERKRLEMQAIPWALPENKKREEANAPDPVR